MPVQILITVMKKLKIIIFLITPILLSNISAQQTKNIIVLIGDGMGINQLYSSYEANNKFLNIYTMPHTAISITNCFDRRVTDSGAGGTAIACGKKTYYRAIGVDRDTIPIASMLEICKQMGKKTGLIVSCDLTHATPASYIAHVKDRGMYEDIAKYYLKGECDIFLGGGMDRFVNREDGKNLISELERQGYEIVHNEKELLSTTTDRIAGFFANNHLPLYKERGKIMQTALLTTINRFKEEANGFFYYA